MSKATKALTSRRLPPFLSAGAVFAFSVMFFVDADRRDLLLAERPGAFALSEIDDAGAGPGAYTLVRGGDRAVRGARRFIPGRTANAGNLGQGPSGASSPGGIVPSPTAVGAAPATLASTGPTATVSQPGAGGSGTPAGFSSSPGGTSGPIGLVPVTVTPDPGGGVVPAVPEPASWILMILGVAFLGVALRARGPWRRAEVGATAV